MIIIPHSVSILLWELGKGILFLTKLNNQCTDLLRVLWIQNPSITFTLNRAKTSSVLREGCVIFPTYGPSLNPVPPHPNRKKKIPVTFCGFHGIKIYIAKKSCEKQGAARG